MVLVGFLFTLIGTDGAGSWSIFSTPMVLSSSELMDQTSSVHHGQDTPESDTPVRGLIEVFRNRLCEPLLKACAGRLKSAVIAISEEGCGRPLRGGWTGQPEVSPKGWRRFFVRALACGGSVASSLASVRVPFAEGRAIWHHEHCLGCFVSLVILETGRSNGS